MTSIPEAYLLWGALELLWSVISICERGIMNPYSATYDDDTLARLHACELEILDDFLTICEKENLLYFGWGGTAIGALRHGGFVPWDDDIDLALPSRDLEKLVEVLKRDYAEKYVVMNAEEDIRYPLPTTRMMLRGTQFCEESLSRVECELGIFLDLYGFDSVADGSWAYRHQALSAWLWSHLRLLLSVDDPIVLREGPLGSIISFACRATSRIMRMSGISPKYLRSRELLARRRYSERDTKRVAWLCDTNPFTCTYSWDEILPLKRLSFEGRELNFPCQIETQLKKFYGNYMVMPPVDKRKTHFPARLDFGKY